MGKNIWLKILFLFLLFCFGFVYYYFISVKHITIIHPFNTASTFSFSIDTKIAHSAKIQIEADNFKLKYIECAGKKIFFPYKQVQWFRDIAEEGTFSLKKGKNICHVGVYNFHRPYTPIVKQKLTYFDFAILFISMGIPLYTLLFYLLVWVLSFIRKKKKFVSILIRQKDTSEYRQTSKWILGIVFAGVVIRVLYFHKFGVTLFQHDWHGHIEFLKYIAAHWSLPLPSKGLEYPQQPLYYLITGGIYALLSSIGLEEKDILFGIGYFSLLCSFVFLYYSYRFIVLLTQNEWVRGVAMVFISLTPSLVYMSARINNDVLVMALSAFSLYYIAKGYLNGFRKDFYKALLGVSILFMTKISSAPMEILLFVLLLSTYIQEENTQSIKKYLYIFGLTGLFLLGFTLLRVYMPVENMLHMVNSSSHYPGQEIKAMGVDYFGTFHFSTLFEAGYSHIFGEDPIRFSFLTYQYGTMFFGEFDYSYFLNKSVWLHTLMQAVLSLGLIFVLGFVGYIITLYRSSLLDKLLFATFLLNLMLILKFMFDYPVVCNTDFRYFVPSFLLLAYIFSKGLEPLLSIKHIANLIRGWIVLLAISEIFFFILLISFA